MSYRFLIVGAGFSGAVLANRLVQKLDCTIDIWDEREHIGGNCHTENDPETGIMVHRYGPHIFNTDRKEIWDFVNTFGHFTPYVHEVKAMTGGHQYNLPVNLSTINSFFKTNLDSRQAQVFLESRADKSITDPANFEEQALHFIGRELYDAFFYGYTKKQWGCEPVLLPASVIKRIPVRFNYDNNYHHNPYTGIPEEGYTTIISRMMDHPSITITTGRSFTSTADGEGYDHVFYTGPIDAYFSFVAGRLGYRTVEFDTHKQDGDFQGVAQVNYCDLTVPYTRIVEHKFLAPWKKFDRTIFTYEYSKETGPGDTPFYPKRLHADKVMLEAYRDMAKTTPGVSFLGRLATYRYMDMHHVIREALQLADAFAHAKKYDTAIPVFPDMEAF